MRIFRAASALALGAILVSAIPVAAQTSSLLDDDLTQPGKAFDVDSGADVVQLDFGPGGMTATAVEGGKGIFLTPASGASEDALSNAAIEFKVKADSKTTAVGAYCRRSDVNEGYLLIIEGKKYSVYEPDDNGLYTKGDTGKLKKYKPAKANTVRFECAKDSQNGFAMILTMKVNGKQVLSSLEQGAATSGRMGFYLEGRGDAKAKATFSDLTVEELPPPTH